MNSHIHKIALGLMLTFLSAGTASAWDSFGHMMVAAVAYDNLTPAARTKTVQLLKLNTDYKTWIKGVAKAKQGKTAFMMAATWPDSIKSNKTYTDDGEHPTNPNAAANIGYSDKLMHRYWHFIDEPVLSRRNRARTANSTERPNANCRLPHDARASRGHR